MPFKDRPYFRRILDFDDLMRRKRPVTASSLAARWKTCTKTVQRFVEQMRDEMGAPIVFDHARRTYLYADPSFHLPWIPVEGKDLFTIGVAMKVLQIYEGTPAARDLREVLERLSKLMPAEVRVSPSTLVDRLYVHPEPLRMVSPEVWEATATALRERTALEIRYKKLGVPEAWRTVEPYSLVLAANDWFLAARDPEDGVVKTFYLSRISATRHTAARYAIPKDFDPARRFGESIGIYVGESAFRFRVLLDGEVAAWASEVRWHPKQRAKLLPDGTLELDLPTESMWEARRFVLSFGRHARALSPPGLVEEMRREVEGMSAVNQPGKS